uniref:Fibroblast growth factor binding protein 3 n=1 Tax=Pseudonaja textilis TaxID=8673 RepID=A0A670ZIY9_PSETE
MDFIVPGDMGNFLSPIELAVTSCSYLHQLAGILRKATGFRDLFAVRECRKEEWELRKRCLTCRIFPQRCIYRGQPELCAAYSAKGRQFWKQILGKLRRKHHPCQDTSPLKSRLCSSKKETPEAQLHLVQTTPSTDVPVVTASATQGSPRGKSHDKNLLASQGSPQAHQDRIITKPAKNGALKKQKKAGKRKGNPNSPAAPTHPAHRQPTTAVVEGTVRPTELNADVVDAYCEEKWHSLCNFFVNFWNG